MNTLTDLAELYLTERVRRGTLDPLTARNYRSSLRQFTAVVRTPDELDADRIELWLGSRGHLSPATRRGDLTAIAGWCSWLVVRGVLGANPAAGVARIRQPDPVPRALDASQVAAVLRVCPDSRARAVVWLQVGEGLRCGEVSRLRVQDWSRPAGTLLVQGKGARERVLPVTADVEQALARYLAEHPVWSGPLVRSYRRPWAPLAPDTISGMVSEWMRAAGVKGWAHDGISAHALRHTAASDVLESSHDLRAVQEMLGHRHLQTTSIYLRRANLDRLRDAMAGRRYLAA
jgi:integrase/recombinase XerC